MRKFYIGFISLAAVLAVYMFYGRISKTPQPDADKEAGFIDTIADSNLGDFDSKAGMIGEVGVETVRKARYINLNKNKEVEREWGFERLLHEVRDIWEIEKPYMNIYQRNFKCYITADNGKVQVETAVGKSTPKDAVFTGNVVFHILPVGSGNIKESRIYLDDITFLSEKSQLTTTGPVKFVSEGAQMLGTGLELVYDEELERLEYLRIIDLESVRIKSSQMAFLSSPETQPETQQPGESAIGLDKQRTQTTAAQPEPEQQIGEYYKSIFSKNVLIDSPEQLVFAFDEISINDIFWSKAPSGQSDQSPMETAESAERSRTQDVPDVQRIEPNEASEKAEDIIVTCDNGFLFVPVDSPRTIESPAKSGTEVDDAGRLAEILDRAEGRTTFAGRRIDYSAPIGNVVAAGPAELTFYQNGLTVKETSKKALPVKITAQEGAKFFRETNQAVFEGDCLCEMPQAGLSEPKNATLSAPKIIVNLLKGKSEQSYGLSDILAAGPVALTFYVEDSNAPETMTTLLPAKLTAQEHARFSAASNQAIFKGNCLCTMLREYPNYRQEYTLSAPRLTIDLPKDANDRSPALTSGIEHLRADGGMVRLRSLKKAKQMSLGGIELECSRFDYDPARGLFVATGPGIIQINNSKITGPGAGAGKFSLRKPCYAFLREFDTLNYSFRENRIIADAGSQKLLIDYFPVVDGKYGQQIQATAGHVVAFLTETDQGQTELATMTATGGITYLDEENNNEFIGSQLFYDHEKALINIKGDPLQPCYLNGALVDGIIYDLKTGKAEAEVAAPGALQL
jgi:hypothetical protein